MTSIYKNDNKNYPHGYLVEQPLVPKPKQDDEKYKNALGIDTDHYQFDYDTWYNWNKNLRTLPLSKESGFKEGNSYVEGVDYEVIGKFVRFPDVLDVATPIESSTPISEDKEQKRMWYEIIKVIMENYHAYNYPEQAVSGLKTKFTIKRK